MPYSNLFQPNVDEVCGRPPIIRRLILELITLKALENSFAHMLQKRRLNLKRGLELYIS
jgi:hypothetical protein